MKRLGGLITAMFLMISYADALEVGVGVKVGLLGAGVDLSAALTQTINVRISVTSIDIKNQTDTITIGDTGSEGELDTTMNFDFGASALIV